MPPGAQRGGGQPGQPPTSRVPNGRPPQGQRPPQGPPPGGRPGGPNNGGPGGPSRTGRPAGPFEPSTENLPPVDEPAYKREPDLLTHRDDDHATEWASNAAEAYDDRRGDSRYDSGAGLGGGTLSDEDRKTILKQKIFRRSRRTLYVLVGLGIVAPIVGFFIMYQIVSLPDANAVAAHLNQPITIYYADNSVMDTIGTGVNGTHPIQISDLDKMQNIQHAVEAAEDSTFQTNAGVDLSAILRTVKNQAVGGSGGASTITQEYIKQATNFGVVGTLPVGTKIAEIVKAYKMSRLVPKAETMTDYLNIVYFGHGAYGIGAASKAYFNTTPDKLTNPQAALLAGMIQLPSKAGKVSYQQQRFKYVMGQMAIHHWLNPGEESAPLPAIQPNAGSGDTTNLPWDRTLIKNQVINELKADGLSQDDLQQIGAKVYTTIQPAAQASAEQSVQTVMAKDAAFTNGQNETFNGHPVLANGKPVPATQGAALVSIDPTTGGIIAWYGGNDPKASQFDMADTPHQPGSSFKPYVFASALQNDPSQEGLSSIFDGEAQVKFGNPPNQVTVHNSEGESNSNSTVQYAMTNSLNTVFYAMGIKTGLKNVQATAWEAGIPKTYKGQTTLQDSNGNIAGGLSIGQYEVRPRDQAQGYATLANYGNYIPSHFVTKVVDGENAVRYTFNIPAKPAFGDEATSNSIARTVIESMSQVASSDKLSLTGNRPVASKTGTQDYKDPNLKDPNPGYDSDAWMCGFTPSVVTAVWIGHYDRVAPIFGVGNDTEKPGGHTPYIMFGHQDPGLIWKTYMDGVVGSQPVQQFQDYTLIDGKWNFITNSPLLETPSSQSSQPNGPGGGGGDTTTTTTPETTTQTTTTEPTCRFLCQTTTPTEPGGGNPGGGGVGHGGVGKTTGNSPPGG